MPWTAVDVGDRHPVRNLQTFNNLARLLPLFSPWIIEQNKILQECDSFPAGFVIGIREFGQVIFAAQVLLETGVIVGAEKLEEIAMIPIVGHLLALLVVS